MLGEAAVRRLGPTTRFAIMCALLAVAILLVVGIVLAFIDAVQVMTR